MTKEGLEYLSNFIENVINDNCIVRIVKQNYALKPTKEDFIKLPVSDDTKKVYCDYLSRRMLKAYEPFMDIIRDCILN